ncbi:hypothetical protein ADK52_14745 [Streptomyces sp. WM6372]|nr:hypothetical protein ADK52_14745 [Streptomyces sp. WM6372]
MAGTARMRKRGAVFTRVIVAPRPSMAISPVISGSPLAGWPASGAVRRYVHFGASRSVSAPADALAVRMAAESFAAEHGTFTASSRACACAAGSPATAPATSPATASPPARPRLCLLITGCSSASTTRATADHELSTTALAHGPFGRRHHPLGGPAHLPRATRRLTRRSRFVSAGSRQGQPYLG